MVARTRLRVRFFVKCLSCFSTNCFSETQLKRRSHLQIAHLKRQSLNTYLFQKCFAKKLLGKIKRTFCTEHCLAYELNKQKTANVRELLRNANLSYLAQFLKVSDEVDASSRAQMTNNAYHVPSALHEV